MSHRPGWSRAAGQAPHSSENRSSGRGLQLTPHGGSAPKAEVQAATQTPKNSCVPWSPGHQEFPLPLCPGTLQSQVVMEAVLVLKFSQSKLSRVLDSEFVDVFFFLNIAIYPEDWEGSNNYLEGWNLLRVSMDYNVPSPYLWSERHSPNPFPSRPINLLLLLSFTPCDSTETVKEKVKQRVNQSSIHAIKKYCLEKFKQMEIPRPFYVSVSPSVTISSSTEMLLTQVVNKMSQRAFLPFIHKTPASLQMLLNGNNQGGLCFKH